MSDSDNKDVDLIINQIVMNNIRAMKLVREFIENELIGNEDIGPSNKRPRGPTKDRGREEGDDKLVADYFSDNPMYDDGNFSRRFRMSHRLFLRIVADLERELDYFKQQWDARGVKGFSLLQKCVSAIRQLAYGSAADASDEYLRMSETTSRDCLENICQGIIHLYRRQYLRKPRISNCYFRKTSERVSIMEDLPTELTIDILLRLPVSTIIHCKRVCKKWRNLVSDSFFVNLHLSTGLVVHRCKHYEDPGILEWVEIADRHRLHHDPFRTLDLNLVPILENSKVNRMVSVNGLICLWRISPILKFDDVYICNPVTREMIILPRQQQKYKQSGFLPPAFYGIGVSSLTGEYKVVKLSHPGVSLETVETDVYTLGTRQWRNLGQVPYPIHATSGPFLNDHFHWVISDNRRDATERICSFDLNKETFQLFPSHSSREENDCYIQCLAVLKGCLCICYGYESQLTIWVMKEYGIRNSWHKEVVITYAIIRGLKWPCSVPISVTEDLKDGSILLISAGKMWAFYPRSGTIEEIGMLSCYHNVISYRPSFLRLEKFESEIHLNLPMAMLVRSSKHITVVAKVHWHLWYLFFLWSYVVDRQKVQREPSVCLSSKRIQKTGAHDHLLHVRMQQVVELSFELSFREEISPSPVNRGILKWMEVEDKIDPYHLDHDNIMTLDLNLAFILLNSYN
ncbi:hypothetical protein OSB04_016439 [Centaurea solstitialis]|uniref:F-box domain-containing protein n=1 Tax=Centaurea solstitialis TaxID=347529 RepID=A0AA38WJQ2_9ASTR|nr:hypothetical protein OSB04_016439 [Centaurea solstitialis]